MSTLFKKKCVPCHKDTAPLERVDLIPLFDQLNLGWEVVDDHHLEKLFEFENFNEALKFTNEVAALAERENHHPDMLLSWGKVVVTLWTHKINGLSENDFVFASKVDQEIDN